MKTEVSALIENNKILTVIVNYVTQWCKFILVFVVAYHSQVLECVMSMKKNTFKVRAFSLDVINS